MVNQLRSLTAFSARNGPPRRYECLLNLFVQRNREIANTESTEAFYSTFHLACDLTHLPLSYPASITETSYNEFSADITKSTL